MTFPARGQYLSPLQITGAGDKNELFVLCATGSQILTVSAESGSLLRKIPLPQNPSGMCFDAAENVLYIACGTGQGQLIKADPTSGEIFFQAKAGHSPYSPVLLPGGRIAYADRFAGQIVICKRDDLSPLKRIPVAREPIALAYDPTKDLIVVAHHIPDEASTARIVSSDATFIDGKGLQVVEKIALPNGSGGVRSIALSPDGRFAVIPHLLARYTVHTSQLEQGWQNTNAFSLIDLQEKKLYRTILLDEIYHGAANPWGCDFSSDGKQLYITHAGSGEVSRIDFPRLLSKIDKASQRPNFFQLTDPSALENDLSFLSDSRERIAVKGKGPRGIYARGEKVWVADYFSDGIESLKKDSSRLVVLGNDRMDDIRKGEFLFHDAKICFENWQSCSSCHPDARADGLNWDLLNDRVGNPKNAMSLLYSHDSSPVMCTGIRPDAPYAVRAGMRLIQFSEPEEEDAKAIDAYLSSLKAVPSPHLKDGELSPSAEKGKAIFEEKGCAKCHTGNYYTDRKLYDVGTLTPFDYTWQEGKTVPQNRYLSSRLTECWRTAPYLHDGRFYTLEELFEKGNHGFIKSSVSELSSEEKQNLIEYLLSL